MSEPIIIYYDVPGDDFTRAGEASSHTKKTLKQLGISPEAVRRASIAMYEGEINMVIHAGGGKAEVQIYPEKINIILTDNGPGIPDLEKAMTEGFSTAPDNIRSLGFGAGMGLPNIKKYADDMKIETEVGKGVKMSLSIKV